MSGPCTFYVGLCSGTSVGVLTSTGGSTPIVSLVGSLRPRDLASERAKLTTSSREPQFGKLYLELETPIAETREIICSMAQHAERTVQAIGSGFGLPTSPARVIRPLSVGNVV